MGNAHWLIWLSSIGQRLIASKRLGTQGPWYILMHQSLINHALVLRCCNTTACTHSLSIASACFLPFCDQTFVLLSSYTLKWVHVIADTWYRTGITHKQQRKCIIHVEKPFLFCNDCYDKLILCWFSEKLNDLWASFGVENVTATARAMIDPLGVVTGLMRRVLVVQASSRGSQSSSRIYHTHC